MANFRFTLPDIGEGVAEAELVEWHVAPGDTVREGQPLAAVMTQKATVELEAPVDGVVVECHGAIGEMLPVGSLLVLLATRGESEAKVAGEGEPDPALPATPSPLSTPAMPNPARRAPSQSAGKVLAAPAVRQRAHALGLDLAGIPAEGERLTHADLDRYLTRDRPAAAADLPRLEGGTEVPVTGLRRQIARHMAEAVRQTPHFTYVEEVDVTALEALREGSGMSVLPFVIAAMCRALGDHPALNAHFDDAREVVIRYAAVHMGVAVQTGAGLMVAVLRDAGALGVQEIAAQVADLGERGRAGKLGREELTGSTITVSSLGKLGGLAATPIVNRPEVAILAPSRVREVPAWIDGRVEPRKVMNLSISCDHRVIDGAVAAAFVARMKEQLEAPESLA